ncbi:MAG: DUF5916 domain-containing protein [Candidatus Aminicenantes bacterium]|nr:DUF5916 domain-containing protein [Candidatus Aminicenantes bacterium]
MPNVRKTFIPALLAVALAAPLGAAQAPNGSAATSKKSYTAVRIESAPPAIDGRLDDGAWAKAAWGDGFIQSQPYEGRDPSEQTAFKVLYDDKHIYVGVRASDSQSGKIERRMSRRDQADGDLITVAVDSLFDHLTAFVFSVNAAGVKSDQLLVNDGQSNGNEEDMSWDPIWDVATAAGVDGWTAEMRIPLSQIRFSPKDDQIWGLQVRRNLFRNNESSDWQLIPRNASGIVHLFGEMHGLEGLAAPHQIEIMPYTVGSLQSQRAVPGNPFATGGKQSLLGGVDGKVGLTSDLTMNFTINPDFGQVEADPSVVNLTAYETFYEEKRPFFVEGRNIYNFQLMGGDGDFAQDNLFYSRRIGREPHYAPAVDGFADQPGSTSILGAFKLSGKTKSGFSLGLLESVTSRESASIFAGGIYGDIPVEPLTSYFVLRGQQDWNGGQTILGGMVTAVNRRLGDGALDFLHGAAYSGGIDFLHTWNNKNYYVSFKGVVSRVQGTTRAILETQLSPTHYFQRPDAAYLSLDPSRTFLMGTGGNIELGKQGGGHWNYVAGVTWRSPGLELNDVGYLRQTDVAMPYVWAGYRIYEPWGPFRSVNINFNEWSGYNFGGETIFKGGNINLNFNLKNYWRAGFGYNIQGQSISASSLRGGPSLRFPSGYSTWFNIETDMRKKIRASVMGGAFGRGNGDSSDVQFQPGLTIIPSSAFQISIMPMYERSHNILQYVGTQAIGADPRYIFGTIEQKTLGLTLRLNYSLTPNLTVQYYGMPFVSAGRYRDFKRITNPRSKSMDDRFRLFGGSASYDAAGSQYVVDENGDGAADYAFANPDFSFRQFRSNLVVRWEYTPGSALYLVWSQGRTGYLMEGSFDYGRDVQGLFDTHPQDVFLVKFSYCFQL